MLSILLDSTNASACGKIVYNVRHLVSPRLAICVQLMLSALILPNRCQAALQRRSMPRNGAFLRSLPISKLGKQLYVKVPEQLR